MTQLTLTLFTTPETTAEAETAQVPQVDHEANSPALDIMEPAAIPANIREARWSQLLHEAVRVPGMLHQCYSKFYQYSIGNLMLAAWQLLGRDQEFGPLATFQGWKKLGRSVKKGEKALSLWMPMIVPVKEKDENGKETVTDKKRTIFVMKNQWFALCQTEGQELEPEPTPEWSFEAALAELNIKQVPFDALLVGLNCQGYAYKRNIAVAPACEKKLATQLHEMAHVVLGHTEKTELIADTSKLARCIKELEAESTAMICLDALGYQDMAVYNRGYIQHWMSAGNVNEVPEDSAKRIFAAADKILKAGQNKASKAVAA